MFGDSATWKQLTRSSYCILQGQARLLGNRSTIPTMPCPSHPLIDGRFLWMPVTPSSIRRTTQTNQIFRQFQRHHNLLCHNLKVLNTKPSLFEPDKDQNEVLPIFRFPDCVDFVCVGTSPLVEMMCRIESFFLRCRLVSVFLPFLSKVELTVNLSSL